MEFIDNLKLHATCCRNMYDLCLTLGIKNFGGNTYREIRKLAEENNIELKFTNEKKQKKDSAFTENNYCNSRHLKEKLINEGIKIHKCERCKRTEWEGQPIPLQIHHINGIHNDNRIENLQFLCPNCHSLTDNFCGKNTKTYIIKTDKKRAKIEKLPLISKNELIDLLCKFTLKDISGKLEHDVRTIKKWCKYYEIPYHRQELAQIEGITECQFCKNLFRKKTETQIYCSLECKSKSEQKVKVTKEELINVFKKEKTFQNVGKYFGVSDKCVAKWCQRFNLPSHKKDLINYIKNIEE